MRKWILEKRRQVQGLWNYTLGEVVLAINTKLVYLYRFSPVDIILEYIPRWLKKPKIKKNKKKLKKDLFNYPTEIENIPGKYWLFFWKKRNKQKDRLIISIVYAYSNIKGKRKTQWTKPKIKDLVLVKHYALNKQYKKKLELR